MIPLTLSPESPRAEDQWRADMDVRTATFLTRDQEGNYGFAHTSFQEFFSPENIGRIMEEEVAPAE